MARTVPNPKTGSVGVGIHDVVVASENIGKVLHSYAKLQWVGPPDAFRKGFGVHSRFYGSADQASTAARGNDVVHSVRPAPNKEFGQFAQYVSMRFVAPSKARSETFAAAFRDEVERLIEGQRELPEHDRTMPVEIWNEGARGLADLGGLHPINIELIAHHLPTFLVATATEQGDLGVALPTGRVIIFDSDVLTTPEMVLKAELEAQAPAPVRATRTRPTRGYWPVVGSTPLPPAPPQQQPSPPAVATDGRNWWERVVSSPGTQSPADPQDVSTSQVYWVQPFGGTFQLGTPFPSTSEFYRSPQDAEAGARGRGTVRAVAGRNGANITIRQLRTEHEEREFVEAFLVQFEQALGATYPDLGGYTLEAIEGSNALERTPDPRLADVRRALPQSFGHFARAIPGIDGIETPQGVTIFDPGSSLELPEDAIRAEIGGARSKAIESGAAVVSPTAGGAFNWADYGRGAGGAGPTPFD